MNSSEFEQRAALYSMPDNYLLTSAEAAIFLRCSLRSLEGMRRDGSGPRYVQPGSTKSGATTRKCLYMKKNLDSWLASCTVSSVADSAFR